MERKVQPLVSHPDLLWPSGAPTGQASQAVRRSRGNGIGRARLQDHTTVYGTEMKGLGNLHLEPASSEGMSLIKNATVHTTNAVFFFRNMNKQIQTVTSATLTFKHITRKHRAFEKELTLCLDSKEGGIY